MIKIWGKNEESGILAHPGLWGWLQPCVKLKLFKALIKLCTSNLYTIIPVYCHISVVYNTRVFFGVIIHEIHRAVQEFYDSSYALTHVWLQWHFGVIFPSQDTIRSIILFTMYYVTIFYCNKYLFIPTLHGNHKFHRDSIIIPSTPYRTQHCSESFTERHPEPTNSQQTLTYDNFSS